MKKKSKFSVVVLHFNDYDLTEKYISNLKALNWPVTHQFIIVDNASPDNSGEKLKAYFINDEDVTVIINETNMGFAKGNNVGICYAYDELDSDIIVVSNNDIKIEDLDLPQKIIDLYNNSDAAVFGPDIFSLSKEIHQSPIRQSMLSKKQLYFNIIKMSITLFALHIVKMTNTYDAISKIKVMIGKKPGVEGSKYNEKQHNVVIHGAFFVLTDRYMTEYPSGLYDKTFLYMEEDILSYQCYKKGLNIVYDPDIKIIHFDGYSTLKRVGNKCNKYMFELKETIKSCKILLDLMEQSNFLMSK